jgi:CHAD domain-containing protein
MVAERARRVTVPIGAAGRLNVLAHEAVVPMPGSEPTGRMVTTSGRREMDDMGSGTVREIERKYTVERRYHAPDWARVPGVAAVTPPCERVLRATYYDSDDLCLTRNGISLRRRTGGPDEGWHVKLPVRAGERLEVRRPLTDAPSGDHAPSGDPGPAGDPVPPAELAELVAVHVPAAALRPVATITTERSVLRLCDADGRELAEIADDHVRADNGRGPGLEWREIETELVDDADPAILKAAARALAAAGARPAGTASKIARVLADRLPHPAPDGPGEPARPDGSSPAGEVLRAYLRAQLDALLAADPRVRLDLPDSVHRMRVACRRTRSTLRTFAPLFDPAAAADLGARLGALAEALSGSRDQEVILEHLSEQLAGLPGDLVPGEVADAIIGGLRARQADSRTQVLAALRDPGYFRLVDDLRALVTGPLRGPAGRPARTVLPPLVRKTGRRLSGRVAAGAAARPGPERDARWHSARKQAKRLRYAAEALVLVAGRRATRLAAFGEQAQELLGERQDAVVTTGLLQGWAADAPERHRQGFGVLLGLEVARARQAERDLLALWSQAPDGPCRRWLR